ncbi:Cyclin-D2-1 [Lobulomyces angularis]|nr:Cyclin-D2-1 [Lobulomyces angularis]
MNIGGPRETNYLADPSYLDVKNKLKLKYEFRSDLIRLMQTLSNEFKYHGETLFMATNFLDRYFQNLKTVTKKNLNLVPLTCIYISSKLNEENKEPVALDYINYSLEFLNSNNLVKFCSFFNNEFFSEKNLKDFEKKVLKDLNFNVSIVTPHAFVDEILSLFPELFNKKQKIYLMDRCEIYFASSLFDCRFLKYKPSILAASTLLIVYEKFPEVVRCCSDESLVKLLNFNSTDIEAFKFCKKGLSNIIPSTI